MTIMLRSDAIDARIRQGIAELDRGEGIPEDQLDAHLARLKAEPMSNALIHALRQATVKYNYPLVAYDFVKREEKRFSRPREIETFIKNDLTTRDPEKVKNGLSSILYWGHYRAGYRDDRVKKFRDLVTSEQLRGASRLFQPISRTPTLSGI